MLADLLAPTGDGLGPVTALHYTKPAYRLKPSHRNRQF
jgi:hypothetical protein